MKVIVTIEAGEDPGDGEHSQLALFKADNEKAWAEVQRLRATLDTDNEVMLALRTEIEGLKAENAKLRHGGADAAMAAAREELDRQAERGAKPRHPRCSGKCDVDTGPCACGAWH